MDWTGATNSPTLAGPNYGLEISGSVTFISAMTITIAQVIYLLGTGNITTNGLTIACPVWVHTGAVSYTLQDDLTISNALLIVSGTFDSNGKNISVTTFTSNGTAARTLTLGVSVITCSGNITFTATGLTMTANTSKFVMTGGGKVFSGSGVTFYDLELQNTTTISGSHTFNDLKLTAGITVTFNIETTQTITTLSGDGAVGSLINLQGQDDYWQYTISCASGEINKFYCSIKNCTATGGATFTAIESTDRGQNVGWSFLDAEDVYPVPTYPTTETVIVNDAVTFEWTTLAGKQTHYDLDISTNGIVWTNYANKVESAVFECIMTAGTFSSDIYYWRVRAYFIAGTLASGYSQTSFIAVINPETSDVACDLMPQPTITWTASEQQAFQLKVGDYDTGTIYSALGTYTVPEYFVDGAYGITVRTQNSLGIWSAWTELAYFTIANISGDAIVLTAEQSVYAVNLVWFTAGAYAKYYIYRDGVPIAETTDTAYADNFAFGTAVYKVRGIRSDGAFPTESDPIYYTLDQLVDNGDFSDGTTGWTTTPNATILEVDGQLEVTSTSDIGGYSGAQLFTPTAGHSYYVTAFVRKGTATSVSVRALIFAMSAFYKSGNEVTSGNLTRSSFVISDAEHGGNQFYIAIRGSTAGVGQTVYADNVMIYDLGDNTSIMYSVTSAQMDEILTEDGTDYWEGERSVLVNPSQQYYTMSAEKTQELTLLHDIISDTETISWLDLRYAPGSDATARSYSDSEEVSLLRFEGRAYPVSAHSGFKNRSAGYLYAVFTRAEMEALKRLNGKTVVLKDGKGNRIIGIMNDIRDSIAETMYTISFTIIQTDYNEAVDYA